MSFVLSHEENIISCLVERLSYLFEMLHVHFRLSLLSRKLYSKKIVNHAFCIKSGITTILSTFCENST